MESTTSYTFPVQAVQAIQPSVLAEHLGFSDGRCCLMSFLWISPDVTDSVEWSRHKESFPPPQRMVSV